MPMASITNPHDRFFRHAFAKHEVAQPFFERYLPLQVTAELDFTTLALTQESFIDDTLKTQTSDLLFEVQTREATAARLYLVLEHKSYVDPWVLLQLLGYLVRLWEREKQRLKHLPLPAAIPLVLYHGEQRWQGNPMFQSLIDTSGSLVTYTPQFQCVFCDLNQDQLDQLQGHAWLAVTLQVLKYIRSDELPTRLPDILALFRSYLINVMKPWRF